MLKTPKRQENAENPPVVHIGGRLKIRMVFCSKLAVLHATEVN